MVNIDKCNVITKVKEYPQKDILFNKSVLCIANIKQNKKSFFSRILYSLLKDNIH